MDFIQKANEQEEVMQDKLIEFLQSEIKLHPAEINLALPKSLQLPHLLPISLWQYGLVNLAQLELIFDWLETAN